MAQSTAELNLSFLTSHIDGLYTSTSLPTLLQIYFIALKDGRGEPASPVISHSQQESHLLNDDNLPNTLRICLIVALSQSTVLMKTILKYFQKATSNASEVELESATASGLEEPTLY